MANISLLTSGLKNTTVVQMAYAPSSYIEGSEDNEVNLSQLYCVLSSVTPWPDDNNPPTPTQDQYSVKKFLKNAFVAKLITTNNISPVVHRNDWSANTIYDYYRDDKEMTITDENGYLVYNFYIKNKYDQVFKCLWNNNGSQSTVEPYFEPGYYSTNNIYTGGDGYKWKYMYSISSQQKVNFMDSTWMPIPFNFNWPNPIKSQYGYGSLDVINVLNGGTGYNPSLGDILVNITGDGTGASANVALSGNVISDIIVTNPGSNYTYATATIQSPSGNGVVISANTVSPIGGHSWDPMSELGCNHVMITVEFNGTETYNNINYMPTDITYYQMGILVNPTSKLTTSVANSNIYKCSTDLVLSSTGTKYTIGETVFQGSTLTSSTFTGTVLDFDAFNSVLSLINTKGTLAVNQAVVGSSSSASKVLISYMTPDFIPVSGYLAYIENRSGIQRSSDGIEQFKLVLGY